MPRGRGAVDTSVLDRLIRDNPADVDRLGRMASQEIVNEIVLGFGGSKSGRVYPRGKRGRTHRASAPGETPAVDTGSLRASMRWRRTGPLRYRIEDGVEYGEMLENGTSKMAARPFVRPVFAQWQRRKFEDLARSVGLLK